jgi:hypothetical protein
MSSCRVGKGALFHVIRVGKIVCAPCPRGYNTAIDFATLQRSNEVIEVSNSKPLTLVSVIISENPVTLPPGRARLATCPVRSGSAWLMNTMGIVEVLPSPSRTWRRSAKPCAAPAWRWSPS